MLPSDWRPKDKGSLDAVVVEVNPAASTSWCMKTVPVAGFKPCLTFLACSPFSRPDFPCSMILGTS